MKTKNRSRSSAKRSACERPGSGGAGDRVNCEPILVIDLPRDHHRRRRTTFAPASEGLNARLAEGAQVTAVLMPSSGDVIIDRHVDLDAAALRAVVGTRNMLAPMLGSLVRCVDGWPPRVRASVIEALSGLLTAADVALVNDAVEDGVLSVESAVELVGPTMEMSDGQFRDRLFAMSCDVRSQWYHRVFSVKETVLAIRVNAWLSMFNAAARAGSDIDDAVLADEFDQLSVRSQMVVHAITHRDRDQQARRRAAAILRQR